MQYYTQRHGMRKPIEKTYDISLEMYSLLFQCCEKYYDNLAWKFPKECDDGRGCCGLDFHAFMLDLKYAIPTLFRDRDGIVATPSKHKNVFDVGVVVDEYDQFALLDYIEYFAFYCRDVIKGDYHSYFSHYHLTFRSTSTIFEQFKTEINDIFTKTGLLYKLTDAKIIERIVENSPLTPTIESAIASVKEKGTRQLLEEALALYKQPHPNARRDAVEKLWDAFERLKTYYVAMDKKSSAAKIVNDMSNSDSNFAGLFEEEFKCLTTIGNNFRIRHHETNKIDITDTRHYDYFFNRCLSLIALAIQYLS